MMKKLDVKAFCLLLFFTMVLLSSYHLALDKKRPFASTTYYYDSDEPYQRLEYGHDTELDFRERTIRCSDFNISAKWKKSAVPFTISFDYSKYIGSISFDEETTADGGSDGQLTLAEATAAVCTAWENNNHVMPASVTVGTAVVTVTAATEAH